MIRSSRLLSAVVICIGLVIASGVGAVAGSMVTGARIKNGTVTTADLRNGTVRSVDLQRATLRSLRGRPGPVGRTGPVGPSKAAYADSTLAFGTDLNSNTGVTATSVATQSITVVARSRLMATGVGTFARLGAESAVACRIAFRPAGGADDTETTIGAVQQSFGEQSYSSVTAIGSAVVTPGSYTLHLRCYDSVTQPAEVLAGSLAITAAGP